MALRHLRCFLAVAEELHFARAAERLHIEQSLLSRTIKEREEVLGEQLFVHTSRSTHLTRTGKLLWEHVPRVFTDLLQARDSVKASTSGFHGQLHVALSDGITPSAPAGFHRPCYPIRILCLVMNVGKSAFYAWKARPAKVISAEELKLYRRTAAV